MAAWPADGLDLADWGHCARKNLHYFSFKLMLSVAPDGIPDFYHLCSARPQHVNDLEELTSTLAGGYTIACPCSCRIFFIVYFASGTMLRPQ